MVHLLLLQAFFTLDSANFKAFHVRNLASLVGTIARKTSTFPPMPLLGFDIETANIITLATGENLDDHGPLAYLSRMQHEGHSIVAWNGLSFDE